MELQYYLNVLWRRIGLIALTMLLTATLAYLFVQYQSSVYKSESVISTGVVDYTGISSDNNNAFMQQLQVEMRFDNLIEFMSSRQCINLLTFNLVHHDLEALAYGRKPFRDGSKLAIFNSFELGRLSDLLKTKLDSNNPTFENSEDELFFNKVAKVLKYDFETLKKEQLKINRIGKTDYVKVEFESDESAFSYFAASKFTEAFINYFEELRKGEDAGTLDYLKRTVKAKRQALEDKQNELKRYRANGGIVDLESQKKATVAQIQKLEQDREIELSTIFANKKTLTELDQLIQQEVAGKDIDLKSINKADRVKLNKIIFNLKEQVNTYERQLADTGGNKKEIQSRLKMTEQELDKRLRELASMEDEEDFGTDREDNTVYNSLKDKHLQSKIELTSAEEKLKLIDGKLQSLSGRIQSYVTNETFLNNLEREMELSSEEYKKLVVELSKEELKSLKGENPLRIIEHAQMPEKPEPNKKWLIAGFAGVLGAGLATFLVFLMTFLDKGLGSPKQFQSLTDLPLIGNLTKINNRGLNLTEVFNGSVNHQTHRKFGEMVRNLRFKMEREENNKVYLITSPRQNDGKSFLIVNLAHALATKRRKVLIVDTNFKKNTLSHWSEKSAHPKSIVVRSLAYNGLLEHFAFAQLHSPYENVAIDLIKNAGENPSLMDQVASKNFSDFLTDVRPAYDYILLEGAALNDYSDTKELLEFTDRVIAVFNADTNIEQADKNSIEFLHSLNGQYMGSVLNKINQKQLV